MSADTTHPQTKAGQFWQGVRLGVPVVIASAPFGILYGALAAQTGLSLFDTILMSATIFGGASQMVGLELFGQNIPAWVIVMSIFAVNFRHVLYSAAVGRRIGHWPAWQKATGFFFLVDPLYAESERKIENGERVEFAWYIGAAMIVYVMWVLLSGVGAVFGRLMPDAHSIGLDFLLPIYFLGLVMGFRQRPQWLPVVLLSAIVSILAYTYVGSPWHVSIGAAAGILLAAALAKPHPPADPEPDDSGAVL
jgi:predicted branched-subunit amino acid permease